MEEFLKLLRETLPEIIGGLTVAFVLAIIGVIYRLSIRRRTPKVLLKEKRNNLAEYLQREKDNILSSLAPGSTTLSVGDIVKSNELFILPPWKDYLGPTRSEELIAYLIDALLKTKRALLLGEAGQGKSTILKATFALAVDKFLKGSTNVVPIYVSLRNVKHYAVTINELWNHLQTESENPIPLSVEDFSTLALNNSIVFLFDGFDEITGELTQPAINERANSAVFFRPSILSCRLNFYELYLTASSIQERYSEKIELLPLKFNDSVKRHITAFCSKKRYPEPNKIIATIEKSQELLDLAQRALLLTMMLDIFTDLPQMLEVELTMAGLYEAYTQKWLRREAAKPDSVLKWHEKDTIIEEMAWSIYRSKPPSSYAYGDRIYQTLTFSRAQLSDILKTYGAVYQNVPFSQLFEDVALRTFLISRTGDSFFFIHKSFQEYYIAKHIFKVLRQDTEYASVALQDLIPVEVATFLKDMLNPKNLSHHDRTAITENMIKTYQDNSNQDKRAVIIRDHSGYYLACLGTRKAIAFLEKHYKRERNKLVQRGMMVGLSLFSDRLDFLERYIEVLRKDPEAASINIGYHLVYYGDQSLEEGYQDRGGKKCDGTVRAIFRHLKSEHYKNGWSLDLLTLRTLLEHKNRGITILQAREEYLPFLKEFLQTQRENQPKIFDEEKNFLNELLNRVGLL